MRFLLRKKKSRHIDRIALLMEAFTFQKIRAHFFDNFNREWKNYHFFFTILRLFSFFVKIEKRKKKYLSLFCFN
jgi:hypothetical protein